MDIIYRPERPADAVGIRAVLQAAFPTVLEARLVDALRAANNLLVSLVATTENQVVGHIAFSPVTVAGIFHGVGLGPLAVLPEFQRRGIGGQLARDGLAACAAANHEFAVVLGEPSYYGRFGFNPANRWGLIDEYGGGDAFQAMELQPDALRAVAGLVKYSAQFAELC